MCTIDDPLGQAHSPISSEVPLFSLENCFVLRDLEKCTYGQHV